MTERNELARMCLVVSESGPNGEPLACGLPAAHPSPHAWASLPTWPVDDSRPVECGDCSRWIDARERDRAEAETLTPAEALKAAVEAATAAIDAAHRAGLTIPPQAAAGVAVLDTTALLLERQIGSGRNQTVTGSA